MTFQNRGGDSSEAMDMVLDNLGMDDTVDGQTDDTDLSEEGDDLDDRVSQTERDDDNLDRRQPDQRQPQRQQQARQPDQRQQQQRPLPRAAEVKPDQRGNLVDAQGKVVAKAGFEARMYQETYRARSELGRAQQELQQANGRITDYEGRINRAVEIGQGLHTENLQLKTRLENLSGTKFGLNDSEQVQAMQLAQESKTNPEGAIRKLLTMAASRGVDLTKMGIPAGGVDTKSLLEMIQQTIDQKMNPLQQQQATERQRQEAAERDRQVNTEAEREVHSFFQQNPAAQEHLPVFNAVLSDPRYSRMSLGEVWARIQLNLMQQNGNGRQQSQREQNPQQRRDLPAGRGNLPARGSNGMAPVTASYDTILRDTMTELGIV